MIGPLLAAVLLVVMAAPGLALAAPACGDTITGTVKLNADLDCSGTAASPALTLATRATLDLGTKTLTCAPAGVGVDLANGNSVLTNGMVTGCGAAVQVGGTGGHTVRTVTVTDNDVGIMVTSGPNRLRTNTISDNETGIALVAGADGTLIEANHVSGSQGTNILIDSDRNFVKNNIVSNSVSGSGIALSGSRNKLIGNVTTGNGADGVEVLGGARNKAFHTTATSNLRGIAVHGGAVTSEMSQNKSSGNTAVDLFDDNPPSPCQTRWVKNRTATTTVGGAGAACIK